MELQLLQKHQPFRIGLIQRQTNRRILNLDRLQQAIQQRYPQATIQQVIMEDKDFFEQAEWWAQQHVVVTMHGAGMTNMAFLSQHAGVVEAFPPHFYELHFFKTLSQSMGIKHHYQWIDSGVTDPEADYLAHNADPATKTRDFNVSVDEMMELVEKAVAGIMAQQQATVAPTTT